MNGGLGLFGGLVWSASYGDTYVGEGRVGSWGGGKERKGGS